MAKRSGLQAGQPRSRRPCSAAVASADFSERPRRGHLATSLLFALGAWAGGDVLSASAAQAQCNANASPSPPPPVQANYSNQSFGVTPPLMPYAVTSQGIPGCVGADGDSSQSGMPGSPGQPGGQINGTNTALTIIGGANPDRGRRTFGAPITSAGGPGGAGGQGGRAFTNDVQGGTGGPGGA